MRAFHFTHLLASLTLLVFLRPFVPAFGSVLLEVTFLVTLVVASLFVSREPSTRAIALGLLAVSVGSRLAWLVTEEEAWLMIFLFGSAGAYVFFIGVCLRMLLGRRGRVDADLICGAFAIYLMLGVLFTVVFVVLELLAPGSFSIPDGGVEGGAGQFDRLMGFSFTTLTTLGYGNISPQSAAADALANAEAVLGQIFLVVVVARLVSLQVATEQAA